MSVSISAITEVEAVDEGVLGKIVISEGAENVQVNQVIGVLLEDGESAGDIGETAAPAAATAEVEAAPAETAPAEAEATPAEAAPAAAPTATEPASEEESLPSGHIVKSPIVGTFYSSPSPGAPAFTKVGDMVKEGDTLCLYLSRIF